MMTPSERGAAKNSRQADGESQEESDHSMSGESDGLEATKLADEMRRMVNCNSLERDQMF